MRFVQKVGLSFVCVGQFGLSDLIGYNRLGNNVMFHQQSRKSIEKIPGQAEADLIRHLKARIHQRARKPRSRSRQERRMYKRSMAQFVNLST